jgi:hypothetical protein
MDAALSNHQIKQLLDKVILGSICYHSHISIFVLANRPDFIKGIGSAINQQIRSIRHQ